MTRSELSRTFLFSTLTGEQLDELERAGTIVEFAPGAPIFTEGAPADQLWVLLEGSVTISRRMHHDEAVVAVMDRPGAWAGGLRAYGAGADQATYMGSGHANEPTRLFRLPAAELGVLLTAWSPLAKHLLDGMFQTVRGIEALARQQSSLAALGTLAAGLAHELNNPASAAAQAASELKARADGVAGGLVALGVAGLASDGLARLLGGPADSGPQSAPRDPLALADAEAVLADRLSRLGFEEPWQLAGTLAGAGLDEGILARLEASEVAEPAASLKAVADFALLRSLVEDIVTATHRIADLVAAVRDYSQLDRAPLQETDVHEGLDSTLAILAHHLGSGIDVVRDYEPDLPAVNGYPAELNQVWTNLLHNASDALAGQGVIRITTGFDERHVVVDVADDGPGMPAEIRERVFDPFFTTKEVGAGTGLGLDISRRIVVDRHHGSIEVAPSDLGTTMRVRLPRVPGASPSAPASESAA